MKHRIQNVLKKFIPISIAKANNLFYKLNETQQLQVEMISQTNQLQAAHKENMEILLEYQTEYLKKQVILDSNILRILRLESNILDLEKSIQTISTSLIHIEDIMNTHISTSKDNNAFLKNEYQNTFSFLRKEIVDLKLEIRKTTLKNFERGRYNVDLKKQIWSLAGEQTALFIQENMSMAKVFNSEDELLKYSTELAGEGLYLEFGVYSGKTINQISAIKKEYTVYGFDSFQGLPETWRTDFEQGRFARNDLPEVNSNVQLIIGWFSDSLPGFLQQHQETCSFVHIDCDLYSSTKTIFMELKERIIAGTILLFDEYFNYPNWQEHEHRAFEEFINENGHSYEYIGYVNAYEQVAVRIL